MPSSRTAAARSDSSTARSPGSSSVQWWQRSRVGGRSPTGGEARVATKSTPRRAHWELSLPDAVGPVRVYLSGTTARIEELRRYADELRAAGAEIVSRWLWATGTASPATAAARDIEDLARADVMVAFTQRPEAAHQGRGGRHVELGIALARGTPIIVIGPPEHVFHRLAGVQAADEWPGACDLLGRVATFDEHVPGSTGGGDSSAAPRKAMMSR
jgi:hypothetical protein